MRRISAAFACLVLICLSLGVGAYFGGLYGAHRGYEAAEGSYRTRQPEKPRPQQADRNRAGIYDLAERVASNPDPEDGTEREKRDLAAQEAMAVWSFWGLAVSALGLIVTFIGTVLLLKQILLTREAVEDTGKATLAMERQNSIALNAQRPWIRLDAELAHFTLRLSGVTFQWEVSYTNTGQMIAVDFDADAELLPMGRDAAERIRLWHEAYRSKIVEPSGFALAPNEMTLSSGTNDIPLESFPWFASDPKRCFVILVTAVSYLIPGETERRYSCRSFTIGHNVNDVHMLRFFTDNLTSEVTKDSFVIRRIGPGATT